MQHPRALVETALAQAAALERLLEGTEISPEMLDSPDARISYAQFGILSGNALRETGNPALGIDFGRRLQLSSHGMMGLAILSSPTVGAALETGLKYYRTYSPGWHLTLEVRAEHALLTATETIPFGPFLPFATETLLIAIDSLSRFLTGGTPTVYDLWLRYREPAYSHRYSEFFPQKIHFEQAPTRVAFDAGILLQKLNTADPLTLELASRQCAAELPAGVSRESLLEQVRRFVRAVPGAYPDPERTAQYLKTSPRSLRRALSRFGTSHQQLVDEARMERAIECLRTTRMTSDQLATHLGFSDPRSFRRAFKRWTGQSVSEFRGHHKQQA